METPTLQSIDSILDAKVREYKKLLDRKDELGGDFLSRIGYLILSVLDKNEAVSKVSAMTAKEISEAENLGYKFNTIYKAVSCFLTDGYVAVGYKDGKQNTYYITEKGKNIYGRHNANEGKDWIYCHWTGWGKYRKIV